MSTSNRPSSSSSFPFSVPEGLAVQEVDSNNPNGRSLHATQSFAPGALITTFPDPLFFLPTTSKATQTCSRCMRVSDPQARDFQPSSLSPVNIRACAGCRLVAYCSPDCQRADWKAVHSRECKVLKRVAQSAQNTARGRPPPRMPTPSRVLLRVVLRWEEERVQAAFGGGLLRSNAKEIRRNNAGGLWEMIQVQAMAVVKFARLADDPEWFRRAVEVLCQISTNAFTPGRNAESDGIFLDAVLSMTNHSCVPNAYIHFDDKLVSLRARQEIEAGDEIFISYCDPDRPKQERHEYLSTAYNFNCTCMRCAENLDVYQVCQRSPCVALNEKFSLVTLQDLKQPPIGKIDDLAAIQDRHSRAPQSTTTLAHLLFRSELCIALREAQMWAAAPLPTIILHEARRHAAEDRPIASLALFCLLAIKCDPYISPEPFVMSRLQNMCTIARLVLNSLDMQVAPAVLQHAPGPYAGMARLLQNSDRATIAEALFRLVWRWGQVAGLEDWVCMHEAKGHLEELAAGMRGRKRERERRLLDEWEADTSDAPEGLTFFREKVIKPLHDFANVAADLMEEGIEQGEMVPLGEFTGNPQ